MPGLNVVALISGGKDSLFSILHCQANGHNVVALANLHPPLPEHGGAADDLESYMYQTIGHAVIPLYEQALGLPLFRQAINGTAVNKNKSYSLVTATAGEDETESLFTLLCNVKRAIPELSAVSTGAIMSDYQRTRVESVALRLGLIPLSYLWQWPSLPPHTQQSLLQDMAAVGQDARIIKVASGGLDDSFLWHNVADHRTISRLAKAAQRFGTAEDGAIIGEGGEYETLAVCGPSPLWKGQILVAKENIETIIGDAGSASLHIRVPKFAPYEASSLPLGNLRMLPLFDSQFAELKASITRDEYGTFPDHQKDLPNLNTMHFDAVEGVLTIDDVCGTGNTVSDQANSIMDRIAAHLSTASHNMHDIAYSIIVLRHMSDFGSFNEVYGGYFSKPNPPARVTIACADALPANALLSVSVTSAMGTRDALHVQSRSYWAPANIGPYSQAISFPMIDVPTSIQGAVFIAGQIPLIPASMDLPDRESPDKEDSFVEQAVLSLQHLHRIGRAMHVKDWHFGIVFMSENKLDSRTMSRRALILQRAWKGWLLPVKTDQDGLDEGDDFDVWHQKHGAANVPWHASVAEEAPEQDELPLPPLVVIQAESLPRGADVEWVGFSKINRDVRPSTVPAHLHGLLQRLRHRILAYYQA